MQEEVEREACNIVVTVGTVIVKDMSRLGRDYLMVGQIQEMLRQKNVRLIAINDNHDSIHGDDDLLPFKNIMNRKPRRLSDEQREQARQRMKKINQQ